MGFIPTSTISNLTNTTATPTTTTPTATSSISAALSGSSLNTLTGKTTTAATSATSSVTSATTAATNSVKSIANNIVGGTTNSVTSAVTGNLNVVQSTIGSLASGVSKAVSNIFSSNLDTTAATMNKTTPDPLKTSTISGTPQSKAFTLNNQYAQTTAIDLQNVSPAVSDATSSLSTIGTRLGAAASTTKSNLLSMTNAITKSNLVSGIANTANTAKSTIASTVSSVTNSVGSVESSASSVVSDFTNSYSSFFQNLAGDSRGSSISSLVDTSLPATADANGNAIEGVPTNVSTTSLDSLYGVAKDLGCSIKDVDYTKFGSLQSFKSAYLQILSQLNMTNLLQQITNCDKFQDSNSINTMTHLFYDNADTNASTANILATGVNDASKTPISTSLAKSMVTNSNLTSDNTSDISKMFSMMGVSSSSVYGVDTGGTTNVYDLDTVSSSPSYLTSSLLNDNSVSDVLNGSVLDIAV